ncbi:hypothetical protein LTS18_006215 [Coniosporium uncinatum]|uniref:Uncharacterized protein n=1 Tax=Coniosporium uncinatum TaxID=93489 RepID=A0ACC3DD46_9PEZI|nr:hypothetical protein LTS18_006215 [Coniosporium uncinatum]
MMLAKNKQPDADEGLLDLDGSATGPKQHRASLAKRLSGRPSTERLSSFMRSPAMGPADLTDSSSRPPSRRQKRSSEHDLLAQVQAWLREEKSRKQAEKKMRKGRAQVGEMPPDQIDGRQEEKERRSSDASEGTVALEKLQDILNQGMPSPQEERRKSTAMRRVSSARKLLRRESTVGSDTEYADGDPVVPNVDTILDNTNTLAYSGGGADEEALTNGDADAIAKKKDKDAWATFKYEIVRLTHTLRLKGWRRVTFERSGEIEVERLSGALTNAVYVVSPPKNLPLPKPSQGGGQTPNGFTQPSKREPPKLLLRIYGPQVEHLIDRDAELQILRRLARKKIGPRLLGTFTNGRFEEFFYARTLTPKDLRDKETSKQIAKRMRELHEGIDLLPTERDAGPFVWQNWDKWVQRVGEIVTFLDGKVKHGDDSNGKGFICGLEWKAFKSAVDKYRGWLDAQYGGAQNLKAKLVFAHNDTQYGNILRLQPSGTSPLLLPANEHRQLVVIDFEYANANPVGLEFANHFTEWCYNYHDALAPHGINTKVYPTPEEQQRFIRAYVRHHPHFKGAPSTSSASGTVTPGSGTLLASASGAGSAGVSKRLALSAGAVGDSGYTSATTAERPSLSSTISTFMLDSRHPPSAGQQSWREQEREEEERVEAEVRALMRETRRWRAANSAMWVAWGVVQAKVKDLPESLRRTASESGAGGGAGAGEEEEDDDDDDDHDEDDGEQTGGDNHVAQKRGVGKRGEAPASKLEDGTQSLRLGNEQPTDNNGHADAKQHDSTQPQHSHDHHHHRISPNQGTDPLSPLEQGIAQDAKDKRPIEGRHDPSSMTTSTDDDDDDDDDGDEEFDYLSYAHERAMFFWGDALELGIVGEGELPEGLRGEVKRVGY